MAEIKKKTKWQKVQSPTRQQREWFRLQATWKALFGNILDFGQ